MGTLEQQGNQFIESELPADNSYGRNGYQGRSSDLPGKKATSGFLPQVKKPDGSWQTRAIDASPLAPVHGMRGAPAHGGTVAPNNRPVARKI
jgi:hypothetical protein